MPKMKKTDEEMLENQEVTVSENVETNVETNEETLAAASLHPAAKAIDDPKALSSKTAMMGQIMGVMSGLQPSKMVDFFNQVMSQFGPGKDYGVGDNSEHNKATIAMKPTAVVREDLNNIFEGQELSEDFKDKVSVLFEAAVNLKSANDIATIKEEYENKLQEEISVFSEQTTSKLDSYLDYVAENWMNENQVAIESTLRNELMEEFLNGLKNLFNEHYIAIPEDKVDVVQTLADKVSALEQNLDSVIEENVMLKNSVIAESAKQIFNDLCSDLALSQQIGRAHV